MSDAQVQHTIAQLVPEGAHVLDLGCGDGALLQHLITTRRCTGYGIEIDDDNVLACVRRGVNVLQRCNTGAMPKSCCAKPRAWAGSASWPSPTSRIGRTA